jgi:hypothetical protein
MKIKVTNTQTIELPDELDPETAAALFENPGFRSIDEADVEEEHDEDESDEENGDLEDDGAEE